MKLTKKALKKLVEEVLNEQPPQQPASKPPEGGAEDEPKPLKIDIPETPFEPDSTQIKDELKKILKKWKVKEYPSDKHRWVGYNKDIAKLVKALDGETTDEV